MSVKQFHTPHLYSKSGVYRGTPIFLIFDPKYRLWVLVRTTPTINVLSKNNNYDIKIFPMKFSILTAEKISV